MYEDIGHCEPAPAASLERARRFINTVNHLHAREYLPDAATFQRVCLELGLPDPGLVDETDLQRVRSVREALRGLAATHNEGPESDGTEVLAEQARRSGLQVSFAADAAPILVAADGADGVLGTVLATIADAMHDGHWQRMKACRNERCRLGLLRPLAQPHGHVVLDAHLRQPPQGPRPPRPAGGRRMMTVLALAVARLRRRPGRGLLTALGVALAAAALVATLAIRTLAGDLALRQSITALPVGDRSATVSRSQATEDLPGLDRTARAALARLGTARVRSQIMLRVLSDGRGGVFRLAAVEDAPSAVRLTSGRLPQPCSGGTCEVLLIGPAEPDLDPELGHQDRRARGADRSRSCCRARSTPGRRRRSC